MIQFLKWLFGASPVEAKPERPRPRPVKFWVDTSSRYGCRILFSDGSEFCSRHAISWHCAESGVNVGLHFGNKLRDYWDAHLVRKDAERIGRVRTVDFTEGGGQDPEKPRISGPGGAS